MFIKWLINTIALMLAVKFVPGIAYNGQWWGILMVGVIFGLLNSVIRPIIMFLTFPLLIFSLGLFTFVINALMLILTSAMSGSLHLGFEVQGFRPAFLGALLISVVSVVLSCLIPPKQVE